MTSKHSQHKNLDDLYTRYGFKLASSSNASCRVYTYQSGYFSNAELVVMDSDGATHADRLEADFRAGGFACKRSKFVSLPETEGRLFDGFFNIASSRERLTADYSRFVSRISEHVGSQYSYVHGKFSCSKYSANVSPVESIVDTLSGDRPALVLVEAAAGFGKTCTAYEVLRRILERTRHKLPLVTELARNRQARIFHYVLLDEIDRQFPRLSSELVKSQISNGRIPVIVDGFDELLHGSDEREEQFEDTEPMLVTLANLLNGSAKVLLTTRRTAIFSGDKFHEWAAQNEDQFDVVTFLLNKPTPEEWLGPDKVEVIKGSNVSLDAISNPVLLSYLRGLDFTKFCELSSTPDRLVTEYLNRLMERERARQDLRMPDSEQMDVMLSLARRMINGKFVADDRESMRRSFVEAHSDLLNSVRHRYAADERPTLEELSAKLAMHAFLDRRGPSDELVGFVNDFVLGTFIGGVAEGDASGEWCPDELFIDAAVTAYEARSEQHRHNLASKLEYAHTALVPELRMRCDHVLRGGIFHEISGETISNARLEGMKLGAQSLIADCVFTDCVFVRCEFSWSQFRETSFCGCRFLACSAVGRSGSDISFAGCISEDSVMSAAAAALAAVGSEAEAFEREVLERFWPPGRAHWNERRSIRTLYLGNGRSHARQITDAIESLRQRQILSIERGTARLHSDMKSEILRILGR